MSDIEKCPFCGGEAKINTIQTSDKETIRLNGQDIFYGVNCVSCGSSNNGLLGCKTIDDAIEKWNKRQPLQSLQTKLDKVVEALEEAKDYIENLTLASHRGAGIIERRDKVKELNKTLAEIRGEDKR